MEKLTKVRLTNLNKILYPKSRIIKSQVIEHYIRMAPRMLRFLEERAVIMTRFPDGIDGKGFYEKNAPKGVPDWVKTFSIYSASSEREIKYVVCNDLDTLIWLANLATLELHLTLSKIDKYDKPDLLLFDLDPEPPAGYNEVIEVAIIIKENLDSLGLKSFVKTSGKKGLHILLPLIADYKYRQTREFVHRFGSFLARDTEFVASERARTKEPGKVYIDYLQNSQGRTVICPYSLRAELGATVSTPLDWNELGFEKPEKLNIFTVLRRSDPWERFWEVKQRLELV